MKKMSAGRIATKIICIMNEKAALLFHKYIYLSWAEYGKGVRFLGKLQCQGVSGHIRFGERCLIGKGVSISVATGGVVTIGDDSSVNQGSIISSLQNVSIGKRVRIGEYCSIRDNDHHIDGRKPITESGFKSAPLVIEDDVWIGRNVTIMHGCTIGKGAVIGANSFVNKNIPEYCIAVGSPARVVKVRS